jgi:hypothetical protein
MRLSKGRVTHLADALLRRLEEGGQIECTGPRAGVVEAVERAITEELMVEDRLNAEIRDLMKQYAAEIERGQVDYQKMFTMIKTKLVRERGLIL